MASEVLSAIKTMALPGAGSKEKPKVAGLTKPHPTADPPQGVYGVVHFSCPEGERVRVDGVFLLLV